MTYRLDSASDYSDPSVVFLEFQKIEQAIRLFDFITLVELHAEPTRPRDGMVVLADGTDWNPGAGQGFYGRYAGAWHKLG